jgi:hypothetical protein
MLRRAAPNGIVLATLILRHEAFAQAPPFLWAKSAGGTNIDTCRAIAVDGAGNSYITGWFDSPSVAFGSYTLSNSASGSDEIFVAKYDGNGNPLWAKSAGGIHYDDGSGIAVDANGNCFVTGSFQGIANFGGTTLTNGGMFLAKYDTAGNLIWARQDGGGSGSAITVDAAGNFYVTGPYYSSYGVFGMGSTNTITVTNLSGSDSFVVKYDNDGDAIWGRSFSVATSRAVAVNAAGDCFLTGSILYTATFGAEGTNSVTLTNFNTSGFYDVFVAEYDSTGNLRWAKSAGGAMSDSGFGIAAAGSGCFVAGDFSSPTITFGGTMLTNSDASGTYNDIWVANYDKTGGVVWAKSAGGPGYDYPNGIATDENGNGYVVGLYSAPASFGNVTLTNGGIFVVKYDGAGNELWVKSSTTANANGNAIAVDSLGNCYVGGHCFNGATFDNIALTTSSDSFSDILAAKLGFPLVTVVGSHGQIALQWTTNVAGFVLESATNFPAGTNWTTVTNLSAIVGNQYTVSNSASGAKKFYRLRR